MRHPASNSKIGTYIRSLRLAKGLSLRKAAQAMGFDPAFLSRVERAEVPPPLRLLQKAARVLGTDYHLLRQLAGYLDDDIEAILTQHPAEAAFILREAFRPYLTATLPLSNDQLAARFGINSPVAQRFLRAALLNLRKQLARLSGASFFEEWRLAFETATGGVLKREASVRSLRAIEERLLAQVAPDRDDRAHEEVLFTLFLYFATVVKLIGVRALQLSGRLPSILPITIEEPDILGLFRLLEDGSTFTAASGIANLYGKEPFACLTTLWFSELPSAVVELARSVAQMPLPPSVHADALQSLYHTIVPRAVRHDLGEFNTPPWLADLAIEYLQFNGDPTARVLDPGCGTGSFLVEWINRILATHALPTDKLLTSILQNVVGFDISPAAVLTARTNYLLALSPLLRHVPQMHITIPIYQRDSILGEGSRDFDYLIGNPPWVGWNSLSAEYKERLQKECLPNYQLFDYTGLKARTGYANDDLLHVFTYVTIDKHLKAGGQFAFIVKQTLFHNTAGRNFRSFMIRHTTGSVPLSVKMVADLRGLGKIFEDGSPETAIVVGSKGSETAFPVPYFVWHKASPKPILPSSSLSEVRAFASVTATSAEPRVPYDKASEWILGEAQTGLSAALEGANAYTAEIRHGYKHDVEGVLNISILTVRDGIATIRNNAHLARHKAVRTIELQLETALLFPYLKSRHIAKWGIRGWDYSLVPQQKTGEQNEEYLKHNFPLTYAYLKRHRSLFQARASRIYEAGPFYNVFGIGPYTWQKYKVVWCGMSHKPEFAVIGEVNDPHLGRKAVVPDNTCYFIPTDDLEEAHFICALLNSSLVKEFLDLRGGKSKRSLKKDLMQTLALPRFNSQNRLHTQLSALSQRAHAAFKEGDTTELSWLQVQIDSLAGKVFTYRQQAGQMALL